MVGDVDEGEDVILYIAAVVVIVVSVVVDDENDEDNRGLNIQDECPLYIFEESYTNMPYVMSTTTTTTTTTLTSAAGPAPSGL